jgi:hypothetical protein
LFSFDITNIYIYKTTINKNKTTNLYRSTSFRFSFIFRYFKVFQVSQIFTCDLSDLLLLAVGSLVVFVLHGFFKVYFDFQNFHLTTRLRWPHYYTLWLVYLTLDINNLFKKTIYKTRYRYFRSGIIYVQNWRVWCI